MNRPSVRHLVWDWNGTLFDDAAALIDSTAEAFEVFGLEAITRHDYQRLHVKPVRVFFERLAGRALTGTEHDTLLRLFREAYARRRNEIRLTHDAVAALTRWRDTGCSQSLLSMYRHTELVPLVERLGLAGLFDRVDGVTDAETGGKAPLLARHLEQLGIDPGSVALIGDSVDDALAARAAGAKCVLYHGGEHALHSIDHFGELGVPVVRSLRDGVERLRAM